MATNPRATRFLIGVAYRLHTSPAAPNLRGGTLVVRGELMPRDRWGRRVLLGDVEFSDGGEALGVRCYVEDGWTEVEDSRGRHTIPTEIATVQGIYPSAAKAYAAS